MTDDRRSAGMRIRREVLGDAHVDRADRRDDAVQRAVPGLHHADGVGRRLGAARAWTGGPARRSRWRS